MLRRREFAQLQECLERDGLPRDLHFPMQERRYVLEPTRDVGHGGTVTRSWVLYTPRQWAHRDAAAIAGLKVPSEVARRRRFHAAVSRFAEAAWRRHWELREAGKDPRAAEYRELEALQFEMTGLRMRTSDLPGAADNALWASTRPTAGWPSVPTARQALASALPALRRLHPDGLVFWLQGTAITERDEVEDWYVQVRPPDGPGCWSYHVRWGVLHDPGRRNELDWSRRPALVRLKDPDLPPFGDSDVAVSSAAEAGGAAFCARTGARLGGVRLERPGGGELAWQIHYTLWEPPFPMMHATVDSSALAVRQIREEDRPRQYRIEQHG
jgi:hypothetical protein